MTTHWTGWDSNFGQEVSVLGPGNNGPSSLILKRKGNRRRGKLTGAPRRRKVRSLFLAPYVRPALLDRDVLETAVRRDRDRPGML